jgi:hypothetical protein
MIMNNALFIRLHCGPIIEHLGLVFVSTRVQGKGKIVRNLLKRVVKLSSQLINVVASSTCCNQNCVQPFSQAKSKFFDKKFIKKVGSTLGSTGS